MKAVSAITSYLPLFYDLLLYELKFDLLCLSPPFPVAELAVDAHKLRDNKNGEYDKLDRTNTFELRRESARISSVQYT